MMNFGVGGTQTEISPLYKIGTPSYIVVYSKCILYIFKSLQQL